MRNQLSAWRKKRHPLWLRAPVYAHRHPGCDALILATGPTLGTHREAIQRFIAQREALVVFACNFIGDIAVPMYHVLTNRKQFCLFAHAIQIGAIPILAAYLPDSTIRLCLGDRYYERLQYRYRDSDHGSLAVNSWGVITINNGTVATTAMGVAIAMGARNIYAVGLDGFSMYPTVEEAHHYDAPDLQARAHRLDLERFGWDILHDVQAILEQRGGRLTILTPTVYQAYYRPIGEFP